MTMHDATAFHLGKRWREPLGAGGYVFLRHSARVTPPEGAPMYCLDLADLYLPEEERSKGLFTSYLGELEQRMHRDKSYGALCVCDVQNLRLQAFFNRRAGYLVAGSHVAPSFFLLKAKQ